MDGRGEEERENLKQGPQSAQSKPEARLDLMILRSRPEPKSRIIYLGALGWFSH